MEKSNYTPEQILKRLPKLLDKLRNAEPHDMTHLTPRRVVEYLQEQRDSSEAGVYAFFCKVDDMPVYVGRTATLWQRLGSQHRSTLENQAALTKAIKDKLGLKNMKEARELLFSDYQVRFIAEPDVAARAMLEIFASISWSTEFDRFIEH